MATLTGVSRRTSGHQAVAREALQKAGEEGDKELRRIELLFRALFASEVGKEFEGMLLDETARDMLGTRAAATMERKEYYRGRWDLADEFLSFRKGMDKHFALVSGALERALALKKKE